MKYQILLSHAPEDTAIAEGLARHLQEKEVTVYFDKFAEVEKWGKNNIDFINEVFGNQGKYCVVLLSKYYANNKLTNLQRQISQSKALNQNEECLLPIRLDNTSVDGFLDTIACIKYYEKTEAEIVSILCKKLGMESPLKKLAALFQNSQKKERVVFEMKSNETFGGVFTMDTYIVNNNFLKVAGLKDITIVGCEVSPHRLQISSSPEVYERIRLLFISGKLNELTDVKWTNISTSNPEIKLRIPHQSPLLVSSFYDELEFNPEERTVVCHLAVINGFSNEARHAIEIIGEISTSSVKECKVYVTKNEDDLYLHSNYKKPGCKFTTKLATNQKISLFTILLNLTCVEYPNKKELEELAQDHVNFVHYYIDKSIINLADDFLCGAMNIEFV